MSSVYYFPMPPSLNAYYRHKGMGKYVKVYVTKEGTEYRKIVRDECLKQGFERIEGKVFCKVVFYPPDRRKRDLDNLLKCLLDTLTFCEIYGDDSLIDELVVRRGELYKGQGIVRVEVGKYDQIEELPCHLIA